MTEIEIGPIERDVGTDGERNAARHSKDECHSEVSEHVDTPLKTKWWLLPLLASSLLVSGTLGTILTKAIYRQKLPPCPGCEPKYLQTPICQSFLILSGEVLLLTLYNIDRFINVKKRKRQKGVLDLFTTSASFVKTPLPYRKWIVPGLLRVVSIVLLTHAILFTHVTIVQFARNFNILCATFMRTFILRKAIRTFEWIGILIMTTGLAVTGVYGVVQPETASNIDPKLSWIGAVLAVLGTINECFTYTLEEKLTRQYYCAPMKFVGMQSLVGMPIIILAVVIAHVTGYEDIREIFYMARQNYTIPLNAILLVVCAGFFSSSGLAIVKLGSAVLRVIVMSFRTVSLFLVEIGLGWNCFNWLGFSSMLVLAVGSVVFHNVPKIPVQWYNQPVMCCKCLHLEAPQESKAPESPCAAVEHEPEDASTEAMSASVEEQSR